ncbi:MAG: Gfo/Idh/MocA family oxidoreductase [Gemmatimonadetes bacterium]|nr:Gfo/Idh/MocA family oxidoreductase [Gemmatimonadota bacterium]
MSELIRWGIIGTGAIAHKFADALTVVPDAELLAVGSRAQGTADAFGDEFEVPRRHASYQSLAEDPGVDAIYVSTPHPMHCRDTLLCLNAGKPVLCEKPFALNAREAEIMIQCARQRGVFLMEAMWTRFLPTIALVRQWLADDTIGEVRNMMADFGFRAKFNPEGRLLNPELGGGALLDIGVYVVSLASMVYGKRPDRVAALADIGTTGVDEQTTMAFRYDTGAMAALTCAVRTSTPGAVSIHGTRGNIHIPSPFYDSYTATLSVEGKEPVTVAPERVENGFKYEIEEVGRCLREGLLESSALPLDETLAIMRTLDAVRSEIGLKYPMEG